MGGSSGGGGGGSGVVEYPAYMEAFHVGVLGDGAMAGETVTAALIAAFGASPWTGETSYDPDTELVDMLAAPDTMQTMVDLLSSGTGLDALTSAILDHARIDTAVDEYAADLDARLVSEVLPRFEAGMRDINAVSSSAFAIGRALIEENQDRQVAKYSSVVHLKAFSDDAIQVIGLKLQYQQSVSTMIADVNRIKIIAKKEETDTNLKIDEHDALWDLEVFQHGANVLAAIGGGTANPRTEGPTQMQSVMGGAMSGAVAGSMISPGWGTVIGAVLGAGAAYMQS